MYTALLSLVRLEQGTVKTLYTMHYSKTITAES